MLISIEAFRVVVSRSDVFLCSVLIDDVHRIGNFCIGDERKLNAICSYVSICTIYRTINI